MILYLLCVILGIQGSAFLFMYGGKLVMQVFQFTFWFFGSIIIFALKSSNTIFLVKSDTIFNKRTILFPWVPSLKASLRSYGLWLLDATWPEELTGFFLNISLHIILLLLNWITFLIFFLMLPYAFKELGYYSFKCILVDSRGYVDKLVQLFCVPKTWLWLKQTLCWCLSVWNPW